MSEFLVFLRWLKAMNFSHFLEPVEICLENKKFCWFHEYIPSISGLEMISLWKNPVLSYRLQSVDPTGSGRLPLGPSGQVKQKSDQGHHIPSPPPVQRCGVSVTYVSVMVGSRQSLMGRVHRWLWNWMQGHASSQSLKTLIGNLYNYKRNYKIGKQNVKM